MVVAVKPGVMALFCSADIPDWDIVAGWFMARFITGKYCNKPGHKPTCNYVPIRYVSAAK